MTKGLWIIGIVVAMSACGGERGVLNPSTPPDTANKTPQPPVPQPPPPPPPPPAPVVHTGFFVTVDGSSSNDGSMARPWDLATAVAGGGGQVQPGDTIWVRGGTYYAPFRTTVSGSAGAPVVLRAFPGERAVIDGVNTTADNFVVQGSYTVIWGLELTNTHPSRTTSVINHSYRADGLVNKGAHNKYVNLTVHDVGAGFYNYSNQPDVEVYGSVFYNIGWQAPDRGHGHALYLKSDAGPLVVRDNIAFNQYGYGLHVYTNVGDGLLNNIRLEGNVSFNSGTLASAGTDANIGNLGEPPANNLAVVANMTYMAPGFTGDNVTLGSGSGLTSTNNYVVGGDGLGMNSWSGSVVQLNNTVLVAGKSARPAAIFVRANAYESGRGHVVVYNWSGQSAVSVNLGSVLRAGDQYEVRNVQSLFGAPVASGTFDGSAVSIPMGGVTPPAPVGLGSSRSPRTGPYFDAFIVVRR